MPSCGDATTRPDAQRRPAGRIKSLRAVAELIETVGSHLTEHFAVAAPVHDLWHYQHRLIRKVLAHTVVVFQSPDGASALGSGWSC